jgi:hypothetical protein
LIDVFDSTDLKDCICQSGKGPSVLAWREDIQSRQSASPSRELCLWRRISLDLVIAIGAQCATEQDSRDIGRGIFREVQHYALSKAVQEPSLEMVRAYLLMAFYMLGECRNNTAYVYLSVAARAAIALGLHSPSLYAEKSLMDADGRLRYALRSST